jgi:N-acyl-D-aspartate/D-glutamate deacylase
VVTPGFIDGHTHMDAQLFWDPLGSCSCWHGVTTAVIGQCGFTLAPSAPDRQDLVILSIERAEDISPVAMAEGIDWSWSTFPEYLDAVDAQPKGINYVANIGHSPLRTFVMGERAFEAKATDDEVAAMQHILVRLHDVEDAPPCDRRWSPGGVAARVVGGAACTGRGARRSRDRRLPARRGPA